MESLLTELATLLRQEIGHYRRLLILVRRERERIVQGDIARLAVLVSEKERITAELASLEVSRGVHLARLAEALGEPEDALTLGRLAKVAPGDAGALYRAILIEFRSVIGQLRAANEVNRTLLNRSLEFVRGSLSLLQTAVNANPTYGQSGRIEAAGIGLAALNQVA